MNEGILQRLRAWLHELDAADTAYTRYLARMIRRRLFS